MNKTEAIKKAMEKRKEEHEDEFADKVERKLYEIGQIAGKLRQAKMELKLLEYTEIDDIDVD